MNKPPIKNTDLTVDDLELMSDILNDYLESFDEDEELFNGVEDPKARHAAVEFLFGRLIGADLSGADDVLHHVDCVCERCELGRGN